MKSPGLIIAAFAVAALITVLVTQGFAGSADSGPACAIDMKVTGMSCAKGCSPRVKAALENVDGVKAATVDFDTTSAKLDASGEVCAEASGKSLVKALKDAGFGGSVSAITPKAKPPAKS